MGQIGNVGRYLNSFGVMSKAFLLSLTFPPHNTTIFPHENIIPTPAHPPMRGPLFHMVTNCNVGPTGAEMMSKVDQVHGARVGTETPVFTSMGEGSTFDLSVNHTL